MVQDGDAEISRDYYLGMQDVRNIAARTDGLDWKYDADQAQSLRYFSQHRTEDVLHYQEMRTSTDTAFEIAVSTPQTMLMLVKFGHKRPLIMDSTFGTNNLKVIPHTTFPHSNYTIIASVSYEIVLGPTV